MIFKVSKRFQDRFDGNVYEIENEYVPKNKEREKQLIELGYIEEVKKPKGKKKSEEK